MSDQTPPISERAWALVSCDGYCFGASDNPSARGASYWSLCIDDGRHSDWWITPMADIPTHLLHMDTACTDDGKYPGDGYEHWAIIAKYAETRVDEKTGNTIMFGWRLSDGQLYGEWDEEGEEDKEAEEDDGQTKAPALFRTTVVIYTRYNTSRMDFDDLAREADCGDAYMSSMSCEYVPDPWAVDENPPDRDFFAGYAGWGAEVDDADDEGDEE